MLKTAVDLKTLLDELVKKYETKDFIKDDPIQFPHRYNKVEDIEIAGFISSIFAFGTRKVFITKLDKLFSIMGESPYKYIIKGEFNLSGFNYRFLKEEDIVAIFKVLHILYCKDGGLTGLFINASKSDNLMQYVYDYFYKISGKNECSGFKFAIPNPSKNGAMKRMWMFLRWMVRKSEVDLGVWKFIDPSQLSIPLDVHVAKLSRDLGLLRRNSNDRLAVTELMNNLKNLDPADPVKYDFALFGYGINSKP